MHEVSIRLADAWPFQLIEANSIAKAKEPFQSALRMRGLFNRIDRVAGRHAIRVSIRLADAWPFQRERTEQLQAVVAQVSIRLADAWPFQP